jgi:hypothetical protein
MLKVGNNICIVAVVCFMKIRLPSPIMFKMSGNMKRLFNLTTSNNFDCFFWFCYNFSAISYFSDLESLYFEK